VLKGSKPVNNDKNSDPNNPNATFWIINKHLEEEFKTLEDYQNKDMVWVRDFTTVADYLNQWKQIKILDFTKNSITIQNQGENDINGLTLFSPNQKISTVSSSEVYYPYIRNNYVVLPRLEKGQTRTVNFKYGEVDKNLPQIINFTDKHIEISDASFYPTEKKLKISIAPSSKPGQDLVVGETEIQIKLPDGVKPSVKEDDVLHEAGMTYNNQILTIKTDTNKHNITIEF
jgi:hypothetical protein